MLSRPDNAVCAAFVEDQCVEFRKNWHMWHEQLTVLEEQILGKGWVVFFLNKTRFVVCIILKNTFFTSAKNSFQDNVLHIVFNKDSTWRE